MIVTSPAARSMVISRWVAVLSRVDHEDVVPVLAFDDSLGRNHDRVLLLEELERRGHELARPE